MFKIQGFFCLFLITFVVEANSTSFELSGLSEVKIKINEVIKIRGTEIISENCKGALVTSAYRNLNSIHDRQISSVQIQRRLQEQSVLKFFTEDNTMTPLITLLITTLSRQNRQGDMIKRWTESLNFSGDVLQDRISLMESQENMEGQGYTPEYVAGLDHAKNSLQLAQLLRQRFSNVTINAERVHIPEFARLIDSHIDFIERGIRSQTSPDRNFRLTQLELLKSEARSVQETEQVTYLWWLAFNLQLALLATSQDQPFPFGYFLLKDIEIAGMDYEDISRVIGRILNEFLDQYQFPEMIMMPTIENSGSIGVISENRMQGTGVHLLGLSNKPINAHQMEIPPFWFLVHDMTHAHLAQIDMSLFVNLFLYELQGLPKLQRERVELVLYELTHEFYNKLSKMTGSILQDELSRIHVVGDDSASVFLHFMPPGHYTYSDVNTFLQQARYDFVSLFFEVSREFNSLEAER